MSSAKSLPKSSKSHSANSAGLIDSENIFVLPVDDTDSDLCSFSFFFISASWSCLNLSSFSEISLKEKKIPLAKFNYNVIMLPHFFFILPPQLLLFVQQLLLPVLYLLLHSLFLLQCYSS